MPTWIPKLAVGIAAIDSHHEEIFARADALLAAMSRRKPVQEVTPLLEVLEDCCSLHFFSEERLMRERTYPCLQRHAAQHTLLLKQLREVAEQYRAEGTSFAVFLGFQKLVRSRLLQHVRVTDVKLACFLASPSVSVAA